MSNPSEPAAGALIAAMMLARGFDRNEALGPLTQRYGPIELISEPFEFNFTDYYQREMGPGILRCFCLFNDLVDQGRLATIKLETNDLEAQFASDGGRRINIDPGILSANRFVLASGKDAPHRIYIGQGVFAELTLVYESKRFRGLPWTYPDYLDERTLAFLDNARKYYIAMLKPSKGRF